MFSAKHLSQLHIASRRSHRNISRRIDNPFRNVRLFSSCNRSMGDKWSEEDTTRLLELKESGKTWSELRAEFPGRTIGGMRARYIRNCGKVRTSILWTEEEHRRLRNMKGAGESWDAISASFPGRTKSSLYTRWTRIQEGSPKIVAKWTPEEDARLLELKERGKLMYQLVGSLPGRTGNAIYRRYTKIGPRGRNGRLLHAGFEGFNDADRDEIFRLHESGKTPMEVHAEFCPERPLQLVRNLIRLGRRGDEMGEKSRYCQRWTRADDRTVLRMRQKEHKTFKVISEAVGRSYISTTNRYYKLTEGTVRPIIPNAKSYTPEENTKIIQMLKAGTSVREISTVIGRTRAGLFNHIFTHRDVMGYLKPLGKSWRERQLVAVKAEKLRSRGMMWAEIQAHMPEYTIAQLKDYYYNAQKGGMESDASDVRKPLPEDELQSLATRIRKLKKRGLNWTEIGLRFRQYSINRLKSLYIQSNTGVDKKLTRPPTLRRPKSEIDLDQIEEYRAKGMKWREIQAHMPDWSESTLQSAYGQREPFKPKPISKVEVRKVAKYREKRITWAEIQANIPEHSERRLRRALERGRTLGWI